MMFVHEAHDVTPVFRCASNINIRGLFGQRSDALTDKIAFVTISHTHHGQRTTPSIAQGPSTAPTPTMVPADLCQHGEHPYWPCPLHALLQTRETMADGAADERG